MDEIIRFIQSYDAYFLIGLSFMSLILLVYCICLSCKLAKINRRKNAKLEEGTVGEIVNYLTDQSNSIEKIDQQLKELYNGEASLSNKLKTCMQNIGIVKFNAFEDAGGEQSFALAVMDEKKDGIIITSLHGRQDTRLYAKRIIGGQGERTLSDEEQKAIQTALS